MKKLTFRSARFVPGALLALTALFATHSPRADAAIFEMEGRYVTIFGYTFCAYDCGYKSGAVPFVRGPVVWPIWEEPR
jgi:hypothetical protein